jgi:hypothetical protein
VEGALLMDQVRLGATGLHVSRVCLGIDELRQRLRSPLGARRGGCRADRPPRPSRAASPSSTPPTSTRRAPARSPPGAWWPSSSRATRP